MPGEAQEIPLAQNDMSAGKAVADRAHHALCRGIDLPVRFHGQAEPLLHERGDQLPCLVQLLLIRPEQGDVVHVAGHILHARQRHDVPVQRLQIKVRQPLADVIPDSQPAAAGFDDGIDRPQKAFVLDLPRQRPDQPLAGDAGVILCDVQLRGVLRPLRVVAERAADLFVDSLSTASGNRRAGPRVHPAHKHRFHGRHQHPLDHAVRPEWDHLDLTVFLAALIIDLADLRLGRYKALGCDQLIGLFDIPVQVRQHKGDVFTTPAPLCRLLNDSANEAPVNHLVVEIADSFRHRIFPPSLFACEVIRAEAY